MKKPTKARKHGGKKQYKVRNWREYNQALVDRGKVMFWITEEAIKRWEERKKTGKRGKPRVFSDIAIETALTLREVFHLPLRQTEGFLVSILGRVKARVSIPDYSTLSKRASSQLVSIRVRAMRDAPIHLVVDSTGAKVYGEGEWKVRQHGWSKHRTWRKLHIGVDEQSGDILLGEVTGNDAADCKLLSPLLLQLPKEARIDQVSADGAFDKTICYDVLMKLCVPRISIPPQKNARIRQHGNMHAPPLPRDANLRRIREIGRKAWKQESGYHRRSIAENTMFRIKTIFTDKVRAVTFANQRLQLLLRCKILNRMTALGMPDSYVVA